MKKINAVPVALGRDYPITIHDLGSHGEGVGRYEGFTVFVAGALPGETVRATILTLKKKYAVGDLREIITASPDRVTPPKGYYPEVGIYPLVTWDYEAQLRWKRERVAHLLTHIGGIDVAVAWRILSIIGIKFKSPSACATAVRRSVFMNAKATTLSI